MQISLKSAAFRARCLRAVRPLAILAVLSTLLILYRGSQRNHEINPITTITGPTMGTRYSVKLVQLPRGVSLEQLQAGIDRRLETVNDQMSTYRPHSELSRFNRHTGTGWFDVSAATARVVSEALRVSELSGGAFDVTVGPLVNHWKFGPEKGAVQIPSDHELVALKKRVGYRMIEVRDSPPALRKQSLAVSVDLSAIAKGFAVDQISEFLETMGVSGYLVEIGGEIRTQGTKADGKRWIVGIEEPVEQQRRIHKRIALSGRAMATSGDYRNFVEIDGKKFSHIIDPRTGWPVEYRLGSVSVVADDCMLADALATTLMVLGPEEGYLFAVEQNLAALLMIRSDEGFVEKATPAFARLFAVR